MKATNVLKEEHTHIQQMLKVLEMVCRKLEDGAAVDPDHLEQIVDFIRGFADACHHGKEEDILFKELEKAGLPSEGGPVAVMLSEHEQGRGYVGEMSDAIAGIRQGDEPARRQFVENARNYVRLLSQHILKENNVLFPMADQHLSDEQQQQVLERFEHVEHEHIGEGQHDKYLSTLEALKSKYWQ